MHKTKIIYGLLNKLERVYIKNKKRYRFFFIYYFIIEIIVKRFFDKLIFENLLTSDNIVDFLERNEFGIKNNYFNKIIYKKDIIDENSFYGEMNNIDVAKTIKKDFEEILLDELKDSDIIIDVENYINIYVEVIKDQIKNIRIYSITIRYYRNILIFENIGLFVKQILTLILIIGILISLYVYYLHTKF